MSEMKRTVKDSVFTFLFKQPKYTLQLYRTLHPEDTDVTESDCKIISLENIILNDMYNDLGILVKDMIIILVEAQSTFTQNILLRMFLYLAATYKDYVHEHRIDLYGRKTAYIPRPELYVVYTGERGDVPDTIHLSDVFRNGGTSDLEVTVHILCRSNAKSIVDQYIRFCEVCDEQRKRYGYTKQAVRETLRICLEEGVLVPFLEERREEVDDIMTTLFDQEVLMKIHDAALYEEGKCEGVKMGMEQGMERGMEKGRADAIARLMERFNLPADEVRAAFEDCTD